MDDVSRQTSPPPAPDFDKFNFLPHVTNLLNLIHSDADTNVVSTEAVQLRLAFHEARSEANKNFGSNLGIKEQEIVIAKLTEHVNAKRKSIRRLRKADGNGIQSARGGTPADANGMMTDDVS
jgi:hypothetical protein